MCVEIFAETRLSWRNGEARSPGLRCFWSNLNASYWSMDVVHTDSDNAALVCIWWALVKVESGMKYAFPYLRQCLKDFPPGLLRLTLKSHKASEVNLVNYKHEFHTDSGYNLPERHDGSWMSHLSVICPQPRSLQYLRVKLFFSGYAIMSFLTILVVLFHFNIFYKNKWPLTILASSKIL